MRVRRALLANRYAIAVVCAVHGVRFDSGDFDAFLERLKTLEGRHSFKIKYFTFLPTHLIFLIRFEEKRSCGLEMQIIDGELSKTYNRRHGRRGHTWAMRYEDFTVEEESFLDTAIAYLTLIRTVAGLSTGLDEDIYSSAAVYARGLEDGITEVTEAYLASGESPEERQAKFRRDMEATLEALKRIKDLKNVSPEELTVPGTRIQLDKLAELFEWEKKLLDKVKAKARKLVIPVFSKAALLAKSEAARKRDQDRKAGLSRLLALGIPAALLRKFWAGPGFIVAFVRRYYPEILLA